MSVTEALKALGTWSLRLRPDTPQEIIAGFQYLGHVTVHLGRVDPKVVGDGLLASSRYTGVLRGLASEDEGHTLSGCGMAFWLGDEDGKGDVYETAKVYTAASFTSVITDLLPASGAVTAGTLHPIAGTYTGTHLYQDPRTAIGYVCDTMSADWRVNGDATLDAGPEEDLFVTDPEAAVVRRGSGVDMNLRAFSGSAGVTVDVEDFSTRVVLLAENEGDAVATGSADIDPGLNVYKDIHGNPVVLTRLASESQTSSGNADIRAQLQLNRFTGTRDALTLSTSDYDIKGTAAVGDYVWAHDPDVGLFNEDNEVVFRGTRIYPVKLRVTELTWPVVEGSTVAYRNGNGDWVDLTPYVEFETDATTITVGGFSRSLTGAGTESPSTRPKPDTSVPDVVTWVTPFRMSTYQSEVTGEARGEAILTWDRPLNVDGSTIVDGDHYEIRYRKATTPLYPITWDQLEALGLTWDQLEATGATWDEPVQYPQTEWQFANVAFDFETCRLQELVPAMAYEAQIRAVDGATPPNAGAWSAVTEWQTTNDDIPPSTPAAPAVAANPMAVQVTHSLGISSGGTFNLERDLHHLEIHGGNDHFFVPDENTLLGKAIANYGMMVAQTPMVVTFPIDRVTPVYFKAIAVDNAGNKSNPSPGAIQTAELISSQYISDLTASKITSGTITSNVLVSGRVATMPTGSFPGVEMTSAGLKGWNTTGQAPLHWNSSTGALHVNGSGGIDIQDGRMVVRNAAGQIIVEIGECADGRHGVQVYKDNGTRVARIGELASSVDEGIELLNDVGALVRLSNVVFGISSDYNVSVGTVSSTGAWVDLSGQPNSPTCQATIGSTGKAMVILSGSVISSSGLYVGMSVRVDGPGGYVSTPSTLVALAAAGPAGAVLHAGSRAFLFDGLPAGTCTFTAKYFATAGTTGQAGERAIAVLPY